MLKSIIIFCIAAGLVPNVFAQGNIELKQGALIDPKRLPDEIESNLKQSLYRPTFNDVTVSYMFNTKTNKTYVGMGLNYGARQVAVLDNYINFSGIKNLSAEIIDEKIWIDGYLQLNEKMFIIYSIPSPETDAFSIYVNEVDDNMKVLGSPIVLTRFDNLKEKGARFVTAVSDDKNNICILRMPDQGKKDMQKLEAVMFTDSFSKVWSSDFTLPGKNKEIIVSRIEADNSGNLYIITEFVKGSTYTPHVFTYFWKSKSLQHFLPGPTKGENFGARVTIVKGEKVFVAGLNQVDKKLNYFLDVVDVKTETMKSIAVNPMPEKFYKDSKFRGFLTSYWGVVNLIALENGDLSASIEAMLHIEYSKGGEAFSTYHAYIVGFRQDGTEKWTRVVYKKQQSYSRTMVGHRLLSQGDRTFVIYNDSPNNLTKRPDDPEVGNFMNATKAMIMVQEIDNDGKVKKYPVTKENKIINTPYLERIKDGVYFAPLTSDFFSRKPDTRHAVLTIK